MRNDRLRKERTLLNNERVHTTSSIIRTDENNKWYDKWRIGKAIRGRRPIRASLGII